MVQSNPKDPLNNTMPPDGRELFTRFNNVSDGMSSSAVIDAAVNTLVSAIRQVYPLRSQAEDRWNEVTGKMKEVLLSHYDPVTQKRRNIFPFTQHVQAALVVDKEKFHS